jgi:hypothetical protein
MLSWILTSSVLCALSCPAPIEGKVDILAHWVFDQAHYADGAFTPLKGEWAMPYASPAFVGEGGTQSLLLPPGAPLMAARSKLSASALPKEEITVEAWVAIDRYVKWGGIFCALEDNGAHERGFLLGSRDRAFCIGVASEGKQSLTYLTSKKTFKLGAWYHVVGTYDGETMRLYENGELVAESAAQSGPILYDDQHTLATCSYKDKDENYRLIGAVHEVKLYEDVLKAADIERRYKKLAGKLPSANGKTMNGLPEEKGTPLHELQPAINQAVTDGVDGLLLAQHRDGSWGYNYSRWPNGATSLCVYTLLKCGLSADHPAVVRGLQFLKKRDPVMVYSAGCQLMALGATKDEANEEWAQEIVDLLLEWESAVVPGAWAYPTGAADISNTQFACLGFWGASELGIEVPAKTWRRIVQTAYEKHQNNVEQVDWPDDGGRKRSGKRKIAGYHYYPNNRAPWNESGCMTTAGLCTIGIPMMLLDKKLGARHIQMFMKSSLLGLGWMEHYYDEVLKGDRRHEPRPGGVDKSAPGVNGDNFYYYIYGLERVGAFFNTEFIGEHPWYRDGAENLLKRQSDPGVWGNQSNTCFALLFLRRASAPRQSGKAANRAGDVFADSTGEVHIRATGTKKMTFWVEGIDAGILSEFDEEGRPWKGMRIVKVEYLADGEVVATVPGDPERPWQSERFAAQFTFGLPGEHTLQARVIAVTPEGDPEYPEKTEDYNSVSLKIATKDSPEDWMAENLSFNEDNLLNHIEISATASSQHNADSAPSNACDEPHLTRWVSGADDKAPWIQLSLARRTRANTILLAQANSALSLRGHFGAIKRAAISINGDEPIEVDMGPDEMRMIQVDLGTTARISTIKVSVLEYTPGGNVHGVGFSGIELYRLR